MQTLSMWDCTPLPQPSPSHTCGTPEVPGTQLILLAADGGCAAAACHSPSSLSRSVLPDRKNTSTRRSVRLIPPLSSEPSPPLTLLREGGWWFFSLRRRNCRHLLYGRLPQPLSQLLQFLSHMRIGPSFNVPVIWRCFLLMGFPTPVLLLTPSRR